MLSCRPGRLLASLLACALAQGCVLDRSGTRQGGPSMDAGGRDAGALDAAASDGGPTLPRDGGAPDAGAEMVAGDARDAGPGDGGAGCTPWPWTPTGVDPCGPVSTVDPDLRLEEAGEWSYDSDTGRLESPSGVPSTPASGTEAAPSGGAARRIVSVAGLFIDAAVTLRVTGSAAPVFLVHGSATIDGTIDVSAAMDASGGSIPGPGAAEPVDCSAPTLGMDAARDVAGGGGGGGGGYGADGGDGGDGDGPDRGDRGGKGGQSGSDRLDPLRGGCPGAPGGAGGDSRGGSGGTGGAGGGAVHLAVRDVLTLRGRVVAAGAGGAGGDRDGGGGGGGGSGGGALIEADEVVIEAGARLCANGGSGGEGADDSNDGAHGEVGSCDSATGATTTGRTEDGGSAGDGGYRDTNSGNGGNAGNGSDAVGGGGGGGGGTGRLRLRGASIPASVPGGVVVSPAPRLD